MNTNVIENEEETIYYGNNIIVVDNQDCELIGVY